MHPRKVPAHAIIRIDDYLAPPVNFTVVKVFVDHDVAKLELARLNDLRKDGGSYYVLQTTRLFQGVVAEGD